MKNTLINGELKLFPKNRIDSSNAAAIEQEITQILADTKPQSLVIDASELNYISSAGLRIILKLRKSFANLKIINTAPDVYAIFDMTGFIEMMTVEKALRVLDVTGCEVIDEGAQGAIYRIDPDTIVKVYKNAQDIEDINRERELARKAFIAGIPTAIPYDVVSVGGAYGAVFELLNAKSFAQLIREGGDVDELARQSVDILKIIHRVKMKDGDLPKKKPVALSWAQRSAAYLPAEIGDKLVALFEAIPETDHTLHGDYHIKNIMRQKDENLLIDMDTLSMGHPIFELSAIFAAYEGFAAGGTDACARFLGITKEQCAAFLKATFRYYFDDRSPEEADEIFRKAALVSYTRLYRWMIERYGLDNGEHRTQIAFIRDYLIENVPKTDRLYY